MKRLAIGFALALCSFASMAQGVPTTFPEGAAALNNDLFDSAVAGRSFSGFRADGVDMRLDIDKDGTLTWYARGNADRGKWRLEGNKFCQELHKFESTCNEFRIGENTIFYKRVSNGEVVTLKAR